MSSRRSRGDRSSSSAVDSSSESSSPSVFTSHFTNTPLQHAAAALASAPSSSTSTGTASTATKVYELHPRQAARKNLQQEKNSTSSNHSNKRTWREWFIAFRTSPEWDTPKNKQFLVRFKAFGFVRVVFGLSVALYFACHYPEYSMVGQWYHGVGAWDTDVIAGRRTWHWWYLPKEPVEKAVLLQQQEERRRQRAEAGALSSVTVVGNSNKNKSSFGSSGIGEESNHNKDDDGDEGTGGSTEFSVSAYRPTTSFR